MSDKLERAFWIGLVRWRLTIARSGLRWERTDFLLVGFGTEES